jgi:hypothetical protein
LDGCQQPVECRPVAGYRDARRLGAAVEECLHTRLGAGGHHVGRAGCIAADKLLETAVDYT